MAARRQNPAACALGHTARGTLRYGSLGVSAADANARNDTRMKTSMKLVAAVLFAACLAHADGGAIVLHERAGAFLVTVFVAPQPAQAGPIDTSVLVQDRQTGVVVLDAKVAL